MSDAPTTPTSTGTTPSTPTTPATGPDEFTSFQLTMAHVMGHPRLREIAATLNEEAEYDPRQVFIDHGVALPSDATVSVSSAESDSPGEYSICVGSTHAHCIFFTLPDIHFTHH
ncbi:hypothetical protein [Aeromicrobium sp.]|uniref:hypothetical protein n=1 Tax=Aeromicrobium sp. TaxID=1871063 RepID=UPI002FCBB0B4